MNYQAEEALNGIIDAIKTIVDDTVKSLPFDRTEVGIITEVIGGGKYKVKFNNIEYILPVYGTKTPIVNEIVKVTIPKNNLTLAYIF